MNDQDEWDRAAKDAHGLAMISADLACEETRQPCPACGYMRLVRQEVLSDYYARMFPGLQVDDAHQMGVPTMLATVSCPECTPGKSPAWVADRARNLGITSI